MGYSVSKLTTAAECDSLLDIVNEQKNELAFSLNSSQREQSHFAKNARETASELQKVIAQIATCETLLETLTDETEREDQITKKMRLELRKRSLDGRQKSIGSNALILKEIELSQTEKSLAEVNAAIEAIEARKAEF